MTKSLSRRKLCLIGVSSALGAPDFASTRCTASAPSALHAAGLLAAIRRKGLSADWGPGISAAQGDRLPALRELLHHVADQTAAAIAAGALPLVIGGDHAIAAGTWRGIGRALGKAPGLIWIDAHLDAHTPESSLSGNPHGMPLAALFGIGGPAMTDIAGPQLDAQRVVIIGARSFELAETALLETLGVSIFNMADIEQRGLTRVFAEAVSIAGAAAWPFGISIDLDAIDPLDAPGVTTPVDGGIKGHELSLAIRGVIHHAGLVGLEIAEYCPSRDPLGITARLAIELLDSACTPAREISA